MGLSISVGMLADLLEMDEEGGAWLRESFDSVNEVLVSKGLLEHREPEALPQLMGRASISDFPYSFLHHLRRFAAHARVRSRWEPEPFLESEDPAHDPIVDQESDRMASHLLCHSDCEGYYLPIDFSKPILDEERIPGAVLGSSQGLIRELISVAPFLGIELNDGVLPDDEADRINGIVDAGGPFHIELMVWLALFEAARLSIKHGTAICFA